MRWWMRRVRRRRRRRCLVTVEMMRCRWCRRWSSVTRSMIIPRVPVGPGVDLRRCRRCRRERCRVMRVRWRVWMAVLDKSRCWQHRSLSGRSITRWPWFWGWCRKALLMALVTFIYRLISFNSHPIGWRRVWTWVVWRADAGRWRSTHSNPIQQRWPVAHQCHPSRPIHRPPSGTVTCRAANAMSLHEVPDNWARWRWRFGIDLHFVHRRLVDILDRTVGDRCSSSTTQHKRL